MTPNDKVNFADVQIHKDTLVFSLSKPNIKYLREHWTKITLDFKEAGSVYSIESHVKRIYGSNVIGYLFPSYQFNKSNQITSKAVLFFKKSSDATMFKLKFSESDLSNAFQ